MATEYITFDQFDDNNKNLIAYVAHHGIRGQKWGERHGPPYPLSRAAHNEVVRGSGRPQTKKKVRGGVKDTFETLNQAAQTARLNRIQRKAEKKTRKLERDLERKEAKKIKDEKVLAGMKKEWMKSPIQMRRHLDYFTDEELYQYLNKLGFEKEIADAQLAKFKRGADYVKTAADMTGNAVRIAETMGVDIAGNRKRKIEDEQRQFKNKLMEQAQQQQIAAEKEIATTRVKEVEKQKAINEGNLEKQKAQYEHDDYEKIWKAQEDRKNRELEASNEREKRMRDYAERKENERRQDRIAREERESKERLARVEAENKRQRDKADAEERARQAAFEREEAAKQAEYERRREETRARRDADARVLEQKRLLAKAKQDAETQAQKDRLDYATNLLDKLSNQQVSSSNYDAKNELERLLLNAVLSQTYSKYYGG